MTKQAVSGLRAAVSLPVALLLLCWAGAAAGETTTVSIARLLGRSDAEADDLLRRCEKNPKTGKTRGKCSPLEAYIAKCVTVHNWRCLRCTFNVKKGVSAKESRCTQVRSPGLTTLVGGQAVCKPGVEPLAGFHKQDVRSCRPGHAKHGVGNFKCKFCHGRGYTPRIGATYCRICPAGYIINKARTTCTPPPKRPAPKRPPPKRPPPKSPPPQRPPPKSPPPPACAGLRQEIFVVNGDLENFTANVLQTGSPLPIGRDCGDGSAPNSQTCPYEYDPNMPTYDTRVDEPTLGHCDFSNSTSCNFIGPTAAPYTFTNGGTCPASYTTDYGGGETADPEDDLKTPGLGSSYIVRWTGGITIPVDGYYNFYAFSDDGVLLEIDGNFILNEEGFNGGSYSFGPANLLSAGVYRFSMSYYQGRGGSAVVLYWNYNGTAIDNTPDNCNLRRSLLGAGGPTFDSGCVPGSKGGPTTCIAGGRAYHAIPKSAFCAAAPPSPPPAPPQDR